MESAPKKANRPIHKLVGNEISVKEMQKIICLSADLF